jgi:hypothetical protein
VVAEEVVLVWRGFAFDTCVCVVSDHLILWSGSGRKARELWTASSEAEIHPRGCPAIKRSGVLVVRRRSPRARRRFAQGGDQPSSEADFRWFGAGPLERGGVSSEC